MGKNGRENHWLSLQGQGQMRNTQSVLNSQLSRTEDSQGKIKYRNKPRECQELQTWDQYPKTATWGSVTCGYPLPAWGVLGAEGKAEGGPPAANPQHLLPHPFRKTPQLKLRSNWKRAAGRGLTDARAHRAHGAYGRPRPAAARGTARRLGLPLRGCPGSCAWWRWR